VTKYWSDVKPGGNINEIFAICISVIIAIGSALILFYELLSKRKNLGGKGIKNVTTSFFSYEFMNKF
jgi:hypothetical protein